MLKHKQKENTDSNTDLVYLKNPPAGYLEPSVDVWAELDRVLSSIKTGGYRNEYEFQADLFRTFNLAHDGHFRFFPDLLSKALVFRRPIPLVSVSREGVELPKVYLRGITKFSMVRLCRLMKSETVVGQNVRNLPFNASAVTRINGEEVYKYLQNWTQQGILQDPDALFNSAFYELAFDAANKGDWGGYFANSGRFGFLWPGAETSLEFENGEIDTYENTARVIGNFSGVVDGLSFYKKFCTGSSGPPDTPPKPSPPNLPPTATTTAVGYPTPHIISSDQQISGYFFDEPEYKDVTVLSMLSFAPDFPVEFQSVIERFIVEARAAGKTRMIVDLSANGGGFIFQAYDAFRQFFPHIIQTGYSRFREHEAFNLICTIISNWAVNFGRTKDPVLINLYETFANWRFDLNVAGQNFRSFDEKFTSHVFNGDNYTNILQWNASDPLITADSTFGLGMTVTGYGNRQNFSQPFAVEDIIMVCAITAPLPSSKTDLEPWILSGIDVFRSLTDTVDRHAPCSASSCVSKEALSPLLWVVDQALLSSKLLAVSKELRTTSSRTSCRLETRFFQRLLLRQ